MSVIFTPHCSPVRVTAHWLHLFILFISFFHFLSISSLLPCFSVLTHRESPLPQFPLFFFIFSPSPASLSLSCIHLFLLDLPPSSNVPPLFFPSINDHFFYPSFTSSSLSLFQLSIPLTPSYFFCLSLYPSLPLCPLSVHIFFCSQWAGFHSDISVRRPSETLTGLVIITSSPLIPSHHSSYFANGRPHVGIKACLTHLFFFFYSFFCCFSPERQCFFHHKLEFIQWKVSENEVSFWRSSTNSSCRCQILISTLFCLTSLYKSCCNQTFVNFFYNRSNVKTMWKESLIVIR